MNDQQAILNNAFGMFGDSSQREKQKYMTLVTYEMELMFFVPKNIVDANVAQSRLLWRLCRRRSSRHVAILICAS